MTKVPVISYKVYLCAVGYEPEIRRITIDKDISHNYFYLKQKLISIFPALKDVQFTISWKDQEGDTVRICTDEELVIALSEMSNQDFKKIFVSTSPKQVAEGLLHPNVFCDGCDGSIHGFRYKCIVCSDFDLCPDCERSQTHPDHPMLRIPIPLSPDMPFSRRFGKDLHKMSKHLERLLHRSGSDWSYGDRKGHGDSYRQSKERSHKGCPASNMYPLKEILKIVTDNPYLRPYFPDCQVPHTAGNAQSAADPLGNPNQSSPPPQNQPEQVPIYEEQKKFVELLRQGLTSLLDPLGPEESWSSESFRTEYSGRPSTSKTETSGEGNNREQSSQAVAPEPQAATGVTVPQTQMNTISTAPQSVSVQPGVTPQTDKPSPINLPQTQQNTSAPQAPEENGRETNLAGGDTTKEVRFVMVTEPKKKEDSPVLDHTWTLIQNSESPVGEVGPQTAIDATVTSTNVGEVPRLYPNVPGVPIASSGPMSVDETMARMEAFGFADEGGWLRQLVENKNGNLAEVLKFLSPIPKPQSHE